MRTLTLDRKRLKDVVRYDKKTGLFYWRVSTGKACRDGVAGHTDSYGYTKISIDGVKYFAHRLAWFYVRGVWPLQNIDHIDRCKNNNKLANLRDVSQSLNGLNGPIRANNSSGYTGVSYDQRRSNWVAYVTRGRQKKHLGCFETCQQAAIARANYVATAFSN